MKQIKVAAAIVQDDGKFLIAQRLKNSHMALKWEFPGGKIEPGEDSASCLKRELKEELDIDIEVGDIFIVVRHYYKDKEVLMHCHLCSYKAGVPTAKGCNDFRWVTLEDLREYDFADADRPVVEKLRKEMNICLKTGNQR